MSRLVIRRLQPQVYAAGALPLVGKIYDMTTGLVCASVVIEDKCGAKGWVSQELYEPFRVTVSYVCHAYVTSRTRRHLCIPLSTTSVKKFTIDRILYVAPTNCTAYTSFD